MYTCYLHGWNSHQTPCSICNPVETWTSSGTELPTPTQSRDDEKDFIHGVNMVEEYSLSLKSIEAAKRTCWGNRTEMQIFAIGYDAGTNQSQAEIEKLRALLERAKPYVVSAKSELLDAIKWLSDYAALTKGSE